MRIQSGLTTVAVADLIAEYQTFLWLYDIAPKEKHNLFFFQDVPKMRQGVNVGMSKNIDPITIFAKLRERYNEEHSEMLTQEKLAKKFGVSRNTIIRLETQVGYPAKTELLQKYCDFFNVSLEDLSEVRPDTTKEKQEKAIRAMGLSDSVVETVQMISECSDSENLLAVVNALIGSKEYTIAFLQQLLGYFQMDDNPLAKTAMLTFLTDYMDASVKPQVMNALKRLQRMDEYIASIPDEIKYADTPADN